MTYSKRSVVAGIACAAFQFIMLVYPLLLPKSVSDTLALSPWLAEDLSNALLIASGAALVLSVACFEISKKREPQTSRAGLYVIEITLLLILAGLVIAFV